MGICEVCGNEYKNTFKVLMPHSQHEFDCFECAIHRLAPVCASCSCRIIGQGIEEEGVIYCGPHCLRAAGKNLFLGDLDGVP
jgi:hypothetical protein